MAGGVAAVGRDRNGSFIAVKTRFLPKADALLLVMSVADELQLHTVIFESDCG